ncbi:MAG TPA: PLP-dependent aminotransferase family protein [Blastocatellia bacterium]|nr:PLP-dependent aminotransferase family protein [Blastocatellia bacterium]
MLVSIDGDGPLFQRVYEGLRRAILAGDLASGTRLPSTRALAADLGVSRTTVLGAYDQLLAEGYVRGRVGSGTYVSSELPDQTIPNAGRVRPVRGGAGPARLSEYASRIGSFEIVPRVPARPVRYDFRYGTPAIENFPHDVWRRMIARRGRTASLRSLRYGPPQGLELLREAIAGYLTRSRAVRCTANEVVIVNGSQQALDLATRLVIDPGDRVLIEEPHYQGARKVFAAAGAELVPVRVDAEGLDTSDIDETARGARLAYVTPSHQFPAGGTLSLARRLTLIAWAEANDAYIIEDDYDSEFRYEGRPVESMQGLDHAGRVIYTGTFSKVLFPALRIGYVVLPAPLVGPFTSAKWLSDRHTPTLEQEALADFIGEGHFERHLRRSRTTNAALRATLLGALERRLGDRVSVRGANAGIHLVAWLNGIAPERVDRVIDAARDAGVGVYSVAPYFLGTPTAAGLLMGYPHLSDRDITAGVDILGDVLG